MLGDLIDGGLRDARCMVSHPTLDLALRYSQDAASN